MKEDLGEDDVIFDCRVTSLRNSRSFPLSIPFCDVRTGLRILEPKIYSLIEKVEEDVSNWGEYDSDTIVGLESYGVNFEPLVISVVENTIDIEKEEECYIRTNREEFSNVDSDNFHELKLQREVFSKNYDVLCCRLEKLLTREIVTQFPGAFKTSTEERNEFKNVLQRHIPYLVDDICELICKIETQKETA
jgi:hypothetical protein